MLYRVDDRLVHGQVVVGWGRHLKAKAIVVCSDNAARDDFARTMMEMGAPAEVKVEVVTVAEGAERVKKGVYDKLPTIALFETPADVLRFINYGVKIQSLNIGGMRYEAGKRQIMEAVSVSAEDCRALRAIAAAGVDIYVQMVPAAKPIDILQALPADI